jgi:hypothetical protein
VLSPIDSSRPWAGVLNGDHDCQLGGTPEAPECFFEGAAPLQVSHLCTCVQESLSPAEPIHLRAGSGSVSKTGAMERPL